MFILGVKDVTVAHDFVNPFFKLQLIAMDPLVMIVGHVTPLFED